MPTRSRITALLAAWLLVACGGGDRPADLADPETPRQWYLSGGDGEAPLAHINLSSGSPYRGRGVVVAVVDNGLDLGHEDLTANVTWGNHSYLPAAYDFSLSDHGTAVAGIIAAVEGNGLGGRGVAPGAKIVAYNALRAPSTDNIADALVRGMDRVSVSNNSWGDFNSWGEPLHLKPAIEASLSLGTSQGRQGLGVVYVFSAGNGAAIDANGIPSDNVNYSGLVNNRYTLPVCAVDPQGRRAAYSEAGATLLVCAPSRGSGGHEGIFTTDLPGAAGYNTDSSSDEIANRAYTRRFGGTSAAAPMVSGVVALMLDANPGLNWRDVRYLLAATARKNDPSDPDWTRNAAGFDINHNYGFGLVDASAAVAAAEQWRGLGMPVQVRASAEVGQSIPDDDPAGLESRIDVQDPLTVEFVDVYLDAPDHARVGDLVVTLVSPSGTRSVLSERHNQVFGFFRYRNWRFGSLRHLGEDARGIWRLSVQDRRGGEVGVWVRWTLVVHGYRAVP